MQLGVVYRLYTDRTWIEIEADIIGAYASSLAALAWHYVEEPSYRGRPKDSAICEFTSNIGRR